jgi:phage-related protein
MAPSDWKPMPSVGGGVREIRIHGDNEYRIIYLARLAEVVYVLHAFEKKMQKTLQAVMRSHVDGCSFS